MKWLFFSNNGEETLHIHCTGLMGERALLVNRVYSEDVLEMDSHVVVTLG